MMFLRTLAAMVVAPCLLAVACGPADHADENDPLGEVSLATLPDGSEGANGNDPAFYWPHQLDVVSLAQGTLTAGAVANSPLFYDDDPKGITALRKVAACALSDGQSLMVVNQQLAKNYTFEGRHGLAPEWLSSALAPQTPSSGDTSRQRWVSACLVALLNFDGIEVDVMLTGQHPNLQLATPPELTEYQMVDGTFWGNLFVPVTGGGLQAYACVGDDFWAGCGTFSNVLMDSRICDEEPSCGATVLGKCIGDRYVPGACNASDSENSWGPWNCVGGGVTYLEAITVVLKNYDFDQNTWLCNQM